MNVRSAVGTVLACLAATVFAIASLDRVCTWLVVDAGTTTRAAIMLANSPLFGSGSFTAVTSEGTPGERDAGRAASRRSSAARPATRESTRP